MAVADLAAPAILAERIRAAERELRLALPSAPPKTQVLALQILDAPHESLLSPEAVAAYSTVRPDSSPEAVTSLAAWTTWATKYLEVLALLQETVMEARAAAS